MNNSELLDLVLKKIPMPQHVSDVDLEKQSNAIRFTWFNVRFDVTSELRCCHVIEGMFMKGGPMPTLLSAVLGYIEEEK